MFVFNFSPTSSYTDYGIAYESSKFKVVLNTDSGRFGGQDRIDERITYYTIPTGKSSESQHYLRLYLPARTAIVLKKLGLKRIK